MEFDADNKIVQLCAKGMDLEGQGKPAEAINHFGEAWSCAETDFEKFTAAHYVARHQKTISDKLHWDEVSLRYALNIKDEGIKETLPSLYLNIGKCYEDLDDLENAKSNYQSALAYATFLPDNGYGKMIRAGVEKALDRVK
jgi:tetratricopeptide (TPR) repeat protein